TKRFLDLAPGSFPAYSLLSAFGRAAPLNLEYQRAGRVLPFPFTFLNNNHAMNVRPANYRWTEFYDHLVDLSEYSFSPQMIGRRLVATGGGVPPWVNVGRGMAAGGWGRARFRRTIRRLLDTDPGVRGFLEAETDELPAFYADRIRRDLGSLYQFLPAGAAMHDPNAYLKSVENGAPVAQLQRGRHRQRPEPYLIAT